MSTFTAPAPHLTRVAVAPATSAGRTYADARIAEFPAQPSLNMQDFGGRTLEHLAVTNVYIGAWDATQREELDHALAEAVQDVGADHVPSAMLRRPPPDDRVSGFSRRRRPAPAARVQVVRRRTDPVARCAERG